MTDRSDFEEDPQLRALLGQSDPARSLTPADPDGLARLLEDTMTTGTSTDLDTRPDLPQQSTRLRQRGPLAWLVAAAAVATIAGGGYAAFSSAQDEPTVPQAGAGTSPSSPSSPDPAREPEVLTLQAPTSVSARCAIPTPEILASAEVAFVGTVTAVDGDTVTLTPTETYAGDSVDEVEVLGMGMGNEVRSLGGAPEFVVGGTYLVSANGGLMSTCGLTGEASPELQNLYDLAFR